jgi:metallophosphoesterase superfamily enzyme
MSVCEAVGNLNFVHLSDIHFVGGHSGESTFDLDQFIRKALLFDAERMKSKLNKITGILVTGDIAFAGKASEFQTAINWLGELSKVLEVDAECVWCVPGNHDVDQSVHKEIPAIPVLHDHLRKSAHLDKDMRAFPRTISRHFRCRPAPCGSMPPGAVG